MPSQIFTSTGLYPELAGNAFGETTLTVPAAKSTSDFVVMQPISSQSTVIVMCGAYVSGAEEVTIQWFNNSGSSIGTGLSTSDTFRGIVFNQ